MRSTLHISRNKI